MVYAHEGGGRWVGSNKLVELKKKLWKIFKNSKKVFSFLLIATSCYHFHI